MEGYGAEQQAAPLSLVEKARRVCDPDDFPDEDLSDLEVDKLRDEALKTIGLSRSVQSKEDAGQAILDCAFHPNVGCTIEVDKVCTRLSNEATSKTDPNTVRVALHVMRQLASHPDWGHTAHAFLPGTLDRIVDKLNSILSRPPGSAAPNAAYVGALAAELAHPGSMALLRPDRLLKAPGALAKLLSLWPDSAAGLAALQAGLSTPLPAAKPPQGAAAGGGGGGNPAPLPAENFALAFCAEGGLDSLARGLVDGPSTPHEDAIMAIIDRLRQCPARNATVLGGLLVAPNVSTEIGAAVMDMVLAPGGPGIGSLATMLRGNSSPAAVERIHRYLQASLSSGSDVSADTVARVLSVGAELLEALGHSALSGAPLVLAAARAIVTAAPPSEALAAALGGLADALAPAQAVEAADGTGADGALACYPPELCCPATELYAAAASLSSAPASSAGGSSSGPLSALGMENDVWRFVGLVTADETPVPEEHLRAALHCLSAGMTSLKRAGWPVGGFETMAERLAPLLTEELQRADPFSPRVSVVPLGLQLLPLLPLGTEGQVLTALRLQRAILLRAEAEATEATAGVAAAQADAFGWLVAAVQAAAGGLEEALAAAAGGGASTSAGAGASLFGPLLARSRAVRDAAEELYVALCSAGRAMGEGAVMDAGRAQAAAGASAAAFGVGLAFMKAMKSALAAAHDAAMRKAAADAVAAAPNPAAAAAARPPASKAPPAAAKPTAAPSTPPKAAASAASEGLRAPPPSLAAAGGGAAGGGAAGGGGSPAAASGLGRGERAAAAGAGQQHAPAAAAAAGRRQEPPVVDLMEDDDDEEYQPPSSAAEGSKKKRKAKQPARGKDA